VHDKDKEWEDILDEIELKYFPIEYLEKIIITFDNGTVWDIDVASSKKNQDLDDIEESLDQLFEDYDDSIETLDFRLDIEKVKKDLSKIVNRFLKKKL
jgi:thymidylate kinase